MKNIYTSTGTIEAYVNYAEAQLELNARLTDENRLRFEAELEELMETLRERREGIIRLT